MDCENKRVKNTLFATNRLLETKCTTMKSAKFQRLTIQSGERYFYVFCTRDSLEHRRDEIIQWANQLARQLCWRVFEITINTASIVEATERKHALFEHSFPVKPQRICLPDNY